METPNNFCGAERRRRSIPHGSSSRQGVIPSEEQA
jgi:hypothetical protein